MWQTVYLGKKNGRLASVGQNIQYNIPKIGNPRNQPIHHGSVENSSSLCLAGCERQGSPLYRRIQQDMGIQVSLAVPTTISESTSPVTFEQSKGNLHSDSTTLAKSLLESGSEIQSNRPTLPNSESSTSQLLENMN
ncbi:unnamed protein product [Phaedon cochleariae]|uniref:Uncharacterized protein n=1 Tax=Phaedon cochleariae TaxID=80249 RepID=A0A9N9X499_PHACE|nr:unnamed protein product [Phaedon cochleariae]